MRTNQTGPRRRRWPTVLLAVIAAVSTSGLALLIAAGGPGVGHFRTPEARQAYQDAYDEALARMPEPTETHDLETSFGTVRAYAWVDEQHPDATPVVLLPGRSAAVPMWGDNLPDYIEHRTVYAFDTIGDTGLSEQTVPMRGIGDAARWVYVAIASDSSLAGGEVAAEKAELIPDAQIKVWPDTTHSLPMQVAPALDTELETFWSTRP